MTRGGWSGGEQESDGGMMTGLRAGYIGEPNDGQEPMEHKSWR